MGRQIRPFISESRSQRLVGGPQRGKLTGMGWWPSAIVVSSGSPPVFTVQPSSQTVTAGATATFTATATGEPTPTYQWQEYLPVGG